MNFGTTIPARYYTGFSNAGRRTRQRLDLTRRPQRELSADKLEELRALGYVE